MAKQPIINGKAVERAYEDYVNMQYLVNRRYQRKLVWGIEEKRAFIDSLANGYPVPLFLFSRVKYKDCERNEVIDGMQRLNAIFSFIENEYPNTDGFYFDLSSTAVSKNMLDNEVLEQKQPILDREQCVKIVSYELPYSVYEESKPEIIDEVFRRINSNGKHLSRQEIRQAGATSVFAQLVRSISTEIRGDVSHGDTLLLSQMKEISIGQENTKCGINPDEVFWVKENIMLKEDLRQSMDEELVADLVAAMVISPIWPSNVSVLDECYGFKTTDSEVRSEKLEEALLISNPENISFQFMYVLDEIKKVFEDKPTSIINHMRGVRQYRGPRYFQILFLSMYELLIKKEKMIENYNCLYRCLENIGSRVINISAGGGKWASKEKNELVAAAAAVLDEYFVPRGEGDPMLYSYASEVETLLRQSSTENSQYDFKQGLHDIKTGIRNDDLIKKIFKTLSSMANTERNAIGYVLLGVADCLKDSQIIKQRYGSEAIKVGDFYITGLNGEIDTFYDGNHDAYFAMIKNELNKMPISDHYRRQLGSKMRMVNYHSKAVIILRIKSDDGAVMFDNNYYTRIGPNNDPAPIPPENMPSFFGKFSENQ